MTDQKTTDTTDAGTRDVKRVYFELNKDKEQSNKEQDDTANKMHGDIGPVLGDRMQTLYEYDNNMSEYNGGSASAPVDQNFAMSFEDLDALEGLLERKNYLVKRADQFRDMTRKANNDDMLKRVAKGMMDRLKAFYSEEEKEIKEAGTEEDTETKQEDCKTEGGVCYPKGDFAYTPSDQVSTWKLRLAEGRPGNITREQLGRAAAAFSPGGFRGNRVEIPNSDKAAVKQRIRSEYKKLDVPDSDIPASVKEKQNTFTLWKETSGRYRWLAIYSNKFRDNDNPPEIISEQAHKNFVDLIDKGKVPYPELWLWHIPGTKWGETDYIAYDSNGFAVASGLVDEGKEYVAKGIMNSEADWLTSHGMPIPFIRRDKEDPTILTQYITSEISPLPATAAANKLTGFILVEPQEVKNMSLPDDKKQVLADIGFNVEELERDLEDKAKSAQEQNLEFKEDAGDKQQEDDMSTEEEVKEQADETATEQASVTMKELEEFKQQILQVVKGEVEKPAEVSEYVSQKEMQELVNEMASTIKGLSDKIDNAFKQKQAEEVKETEETPAASNLASIWKSAIGTEETVVDGRTKLGGAEPEMPDQLKNAGQQPQNWSLNQLFAPVKEYNENGAQ